MRRHLRAFAFTILAAASVPAHSQTAPDTAGAGVPGSELSVYLMTMGQGDLVWERFGHNAIGIRDRRANTDLVYNWGLFSFSQPGFISRFLQGEMMYWMAPGDAAATIMEYAAFNRTVWIQELNLSPAQRLALREFVEWNAREENKYYRYDYFRDNCSTRVRDALDRVLGGLLRQSSERDTTTFTYRDHALRLMAEDVLMSTGIDIGLGRPTDRPITGWEEMFIPMRVRDRVRALRVPDETGALVPLVTSERTVFEAQRSPERETPPRRWPAFLAVGLAFLALFAVMTRRTDAGVPVARRVAWSVVVGWCLLVGVLGCALVYLRAFTQHEASYDNTNLFFYSPLWLLVALLAPLAARRAGLRRGADITLKAAGWLTVVGLVTLLLPWFRQGSIAVVLLVAPPNLAALVAIRRLLESRSPAAAPP